MTTPASSPDRGATLGVYGIVYFQNRQGRDRFAATVLEQAQARGFVAAPWPDAGFPQGGNVAFQAVLGLLSPGLRLCWLHYDQAVVDQAVVDLQTEAATQGRAGNTEPDVFGSGQVSQLPLAQYLLTVSG